MTRVDDDREDVGSTKTMPSTGWCRRVWWCLRGGARRLKRRRWERVLRHEALCGDVFLALRMARVDPKDVLWAIACFPDVPSRERFWRIVLSGGCTTCGALGREPCDAGLHS